MGHDVIIRGGEVLDGTGAPPARADIAVSGDRIALVGDVGDAPAGEVIDATGLTVTPGFVDVLSHAYTSILSDPRGLSALKQGVTTLVFGEGFSMGPWCDRAVAFLRSFGYASLEKDFPWRRLSEYLAFAESLGISHNVASFVGATSLRLCAMGTEDRPATPAELDAMCAMAREEAEDGALGIGSALIYAPGSFAPTGELVALCRAVAPHGGSYISHLRSEGRGFEAAVEELLQISREGGVPAEIYHLKVAGEASWPTMDRVIARLEEVRAAGEPIWADIYPYTAGSTSLSASVPPSFQQGDAGDLRRLLQDPAARAAVRDEILADAGGWENLFLLAGGGEGVLILDGHTPETQALRGRYLAEVAREADEDALDTLLRLTAVDPGAEAAYFIASEENLRRQVQLPWVSVGSDARAIAAEGEALDTPVHPRTYGTFARILGHYVRDEGLVTLPEAVRRMTSLPCTNLGLRDRGVITEGAFADLAVLDPDTITDVATYADPHRYAVGVRDVVVNGSVVLRDGAHTGAGPGRALGRGR